MKRVLVIDNYDSFVYNIVHYLEMFDCKVTVKRNDAILLDEVADYDKILLSPGPGVPQEAEILNRILRAYAPQKSILGVCLGHQAIGEFYGAGLHNLKNVFHGVASVLTLTTQDEYLFAGLCDNMEVGRYHSWTVTSPLPPELEITAIDEEGNIMALRHREYDVRSVQFHPESILTPYGKEIIKNWIIN